MYNSKRVPQNNVRRLLIVWGMHSETVPKFEIETGHKYVCINHY